MADVVVDFDFFEQLVDRKRAALHFDQRFGDVQLADRNFGQQIGQQPGIVDFNKGCLPRPLFQGKQQAFFDFCLIELVDLGGREQRPVAEHSFAVELVETMGALQMGGKFAQLLLFPKPNLDHLEVPMFWVLTWADLKNFADRKFQRRKNNVLSGLVALLRHVDGTLAQLLGNADVLAAQILFDQRSGQRFQRDWLLFFEDQLVQKFSIVCCDFKLVTPESCCLCWALQHAFLLNWFENVDSLWRWLRK